jgi:hypothetical protein
MFRFEHRRQKLATRAVFLQRVGWSLFIALGAIGASLVLGIAGYMALAGLSFVDAFLNAAMILGGMGPVTTLESDWAKVFAGLYALYSGLLLIGVTGVVLAPVFHRVLHAIHADEK